MQKLHLVGFTQDLDGLILSTRKGAKSGSFVVPVDANLLQVLGDAARPAEPTGAARSNGVRHGGTPRQTRPESQLGPREMQELLRRGWSLEEVAVEAGVDVDWVSRFAAPVKAQMRLVLDQGCAAVFDKPRAGPSALPLAASVRRNVAERGVRFTDDDFQAGWRAYQLDDTLWVVAFEYTSRSRTQVADWTLDLDTGELTSRGRLGTQLGHVQSTRRRVSTAPTPKPKPKVAAVKAATRAATRPPVVVPAPSRRVLQTPRRATQAKTAAPAPRSRARQSGTRAPSASTKKSTGGRTPKPPASASGSAQSLSFPTAQAGRDPWRDELRRREAEHAATAPPPPAAPRSSRSESDSESDPESDPEQRRVAVIGPTMRMMRRRSVPVPRRGPTTGPQPVVQADEEQWPDLEWSPGREKSGQLPSVAPVPVPAPERNTAAWVAPARPTFKGARAATPATRPRRSEPLRGR